MLVAMATLKSDKMGRDCNTISFVAFILGLDLLSDSGGLVL